MKFFAAFSYTCKSPGGALPNIRKQQYHAIFMYKVHFYKTSADHSHLKMVNYKMVAIIISVL